MTKFVTNEWFWGCNMIFRARVRSENENFFRQGGLLFDDFVSIFWLFCGQNDASCDNFILRPRPIFDNFVGVSSCFFLRDRTIF